MGNKLVTSPYDRDDLNSIKSCPKHAHETTVRQEAVPTPVHRPINKEMLKMASSAIADVPSECPMHQAKDEKKAGECPVPHDQRSKAPEGCPIPHDQKSKSDYDPLNNMPPPNQMPSAGQPFPLSTQRVTSGIPKAGTSDKWVYPSEQMFWNAMLRKGWRWEDDTIQKDDMSHIINIHNSNNEKAWHEVLMWEAMHCE